MHEYNKSKVPLPKASPGASRATMKTERSEGVALHREAKEAKVAKEAKETKEAKEAKDMKEATPWSLSAVDQATQGGRITS